jgi:hypothetical protein
VLHAKSGVYAFNVLTAALRADAATAEATIRYAQDERALVAACAGAAEAGERVLAGWSFCSPEAAGVCASLAASQRRGCSRARPHHAPREPALRSLHHADGALVRRGGDGAEPRPGGGVARGARVHAHSFMPLPGTPLKDAPAGRVDEETQRAVTRLESRGAAYGQWRRQLVAAASLSRRRGD